MHRDGAAHQVYQLLGDGHTQTRALKLGAGVFALLRKRFIDVPLELLAHTDAGILNREAVDGVGRILRQLIQRIVDGAAHAVVLDRIAGNIGNHALDVQRAAVDVVVHVVELHVAGQLHTVALGVQGVPVAGQQLIQVERLVQNHHAAAFQPAHIQHIVNQRFQLQARGGQLGQRTADHLGVIGVVLRNLGHTQNSVQRGADVMAHAGEEVCLGLVRSLGAVTRLNQPLLPLVQLVAVAEGHNPDGMAVAEGFVLLAELEPPRVAAQGAQALGLLAAEMAEALHLAQRAVLRKAVGKLHRVPGAEHLIAVIAQRLQGQLTDDADGQPRRIEATHHADAVVQPQQLLNQGINLLQILTLEITAEKGFFVETLYHFLLLSYTLQILI